MTLTIEQTLQNADGLIDTYRPLAQSIGRVPRGVSHIEMFFFFATVSPLKPGRIIESGRAQGQSTLLASLCFPDTPIISIERDAKHADVAIAEQRLKDRPNVQCLFGDARKQLPAKTQEGDVVLIDGPKEFRALKLAAKLMRDNKPAAIFMHDCYKGSAIRRYLDRHMPWVFYADDATFQERFGDLDVNLDTKAIGLACISPHPDITSWSRWLHVTTMRWFDNILG